jgi:hypothetical protein
MASSSYCRRGGRTQLIVLLVVLAISAIVAIWYWIQPRTQPAAETGRQIATSFLDKIRAGHADQAWESTTAEFKSAQGKESFIQSTKYEQHAKKEMQFVSMQTVLVQEVPRAEYVFRSDDGQTLRLVIGKESGQWKVDRLLK